MSLHLLMVGGTNSEVQLKELAAFAARPENWFYPGKSDFVPGDRPEYVRELEVMDAQGAPFHVRVVFSYTVYDGTLGRHASISIGDRSELPSPFAVFVVCHFLGFAGRFRDWEFGAHRNEPGVMVVCQTIKGIQEAHA